MTLEDLLHSLQIIADNNPELLQQPVSCYYYAKKLEFEIDKVYKSLGEGSAETIINIQ